MSSRPMRLRLWEAMERWPDETFAPLAGAVCHAVKERYPALLCQAVCGHWGYAPAMEFEIANDEPVCMRCCGVLERAAAGGRVGGDEL